MGPDSHGVSACAPKALNQTRDLTSHPWSPTGLSCLPLLWCTSCQSHQPPRVLLKHSLDSPSPRTAASVLVSLGRPQGRAPLPHATVWTVLGRTCSPACASLDSLECILLLGRHGHAEPTSGQQRKPGIATDGGKCCAQVQEPRS